MLVIGMCFITRYEIWGLNMSEFLPIFLLFIIFDFDLWPWTSVKVTITLVTRLELHTIIIIELNKIISYAYKANLKLKEFVKNRVSPTTFFFFQLKIFSHNATKFKLRLTPAWTDIITFSFLHLHEIVEGLYFHFSLSVCVCVCVSVRLLTKCRSNRYTNFDAVFAK